MDIRRTYTDITLLQAMRSDINADEAIRHLYRSQFNITRAYIKQNNGSEEDAEDIFQEVVFTFIELVKKDKFRGESSISTFLYALTRNIWLNEVKKRGRAKLRDDDGRFVAQSVSTRAKLRPSLFRHQREYPTANGW